MVRDSGQTYLQPVGRGREEEGERKRKTWGGEARRTAAANLVVKRAQVGVVPGWVTEREVLSATPLGSVEARGNGGRRPVGSGQLGFRCAGTNP
ncbi:hypothetical protein ACLOJK_007240 [Asimina triloba]